MILFINSLTLLLIFYFSKYPKKHNILHPKKLFLIFFGIVQVSGFFLISLIKFVDGSYKVKDDLLLRISFTTLLALLCFLIFNFFIKKFDSYIFRTLKLPKLDSFIFKQLSVVFLSIGFLGLSIYFFKNGFTFFKEGGYENKNLNNIGVGYARIMYSYGFGFALISYLAVSYTKRKFVNSILLSLIIGVLIFIIVGGGRSASLNLVVLSVIIAIYNNRIKLKKIIFLGVLFTVGIFFLTVLRYKLSLNANNISLFLYQFQGSFSPVDSFAKIYETMPTVLNFKPELFFNSFKTLIPRSIWISKPIDIQVPSVFFTQEILSYPSFLTISPTLLGELYIYNGYFGIIIGMFVCAILVRVMTIIYLKAYRSLNMKVYYLLNVLFGFSLFREGISISLRNFFFFSIVFTFFAFFVEFVRLTTLKK